MVVLAGGGLLRQALLYRTFPAEAKPCAVAGDDLMAA